MLTRRTLMFTAAAAALFAVGPAFPAGAQGTGAAQATAFVQGAAGDLVRVVNGTAPEAQKKIELQQIVDRVVDVDDIGRFCLGRFWRTATPQQQAEYLQIFHAVLMNNITSKIGDYRGVNYALGRAVPRDETTVVYSTVTRPNNAPASVQWVISAATGSPKIVDIYAEGTSLRQTQRADYASYLARNNNDVGALIRAMRQQVQNQG